MGVAEEMKLPIGFRFRPTDEELMVHYLRRKALSLPLPASIIPELDVFHSDPWSLPGEMNEKRYFFWKKRKSDSSNRKRVLCNKTSSGYWKCNRSSSSNNNNNNNSCRGKGKQIVVSFPTPSGITRQFVVGTRKTWTFYQRKNRSTSKSKSYSTKTRWILHEFQLPEHHQNNCSNNNTISSDQVQDDWHDWVVCRVFQRKNIATATKSNKIKNNTGNNNIVKKAMRCDEMKPAQNYCTISNDQLGCTPTTESETAPLAAAAAAPAPASSPCASDITSEEDAMPLLVSSCTNDQDDSTCSSSCNITIRVPVSN